MKPPEQFTLLSPDGIDGGLATREAHEGLPLKGKKILVTGGTNRIPAPGGTTFLEGTGRAYARRVHTLGADVIVSTHRPDSYASVEEEFGGERIHALYMDLTKPEQIQEGVGVLVSEGLIPNAVGNFSAGGVNVLGRPFLHHLAQLRKIDLSNTVARVEKMAEIKDFLKQQTTDADNWAAAMAVNFHGPKMLTELLVPHMKKGSVIESLSSTPSSKWQKAGYPECPEFYKLVAGPKWEFEKWLEEKGPELAKQGIYTVIVSAYEIANTPVGDFIDRNLKPLLTEEEQAIMTEATVERDDVTEAMASYLLGDPTEWNAYPQRLYIIGSKDGVQKVNDIPADYPIFSIQFPL